jgi:hypothetical protein
MYTVTSESLCERSPLNVGTFGREMTSSSVCISSPANELKDECL